MVVMVCRWMANTQLQKTQKMVWLQRWKDWVPKGTVKQIEKSLINDPLRVSKVSWKFRIPAIYNFEVIHREIRYFLKK